MSSECVVALYDTTADATEAVEALNRAGFPRDQVSVATKTLKPEAEVRQALEFGDESAKDAAIGAGAGVLVGLLSATAIWSVTGAGVFFLAGPILAPGIVGMLLGAAVGWRVHKDHLPYFEKKLREGKVLVIAYGDPRQAAEAERVLQDTEPVKLHLYTKTSADSP